MAVLFFALERKKKKSAPVKGRVSYLRSPIFASVNYGALRVYTRREYKRDGTRYAVDSITGYIMRFSYVVSTSNITFFTTEFLFGNI